MRLAPVHPRMAAYTQSPERVCILQDYLVPLTPVHLLMVSKYLSPSSAWHMMHTKAEAMGMTPCVASFMDWLRAETVAPQQGIAALTIVDLYDSTMAQWNGIRTRLAPLPPPMHPSSQ